MRTEYHPDSVSPPGETIGEILKLEGMSRVAFAEAMNYSEASVYRLLNGEMRITPAVALQLERVLRVTAGFWMSREIAYSKSIGREYTNPDAIGAFIDATRSE